MSIIASDDFIWASRLIDAPRMVCQSFSTELVQLYKSSSTARQQLSDNPSTIRRQSVDNPSSDAENLSMMLVHATVIDPISRATNT
jgi:hypothetical protein